MVEFGPGDKWPSHPKSYWRETLDYARAMGWRLKKTTDHAFGRIICESGDCEFVVYSTGSAGENAAKSARKRVEQCVHSASSRSLLAAVDNLLEKAEKAIVAADAMLGKERAEAAAFLLGEAEELMRGPAVWDDFRQLVDEVDIQTNIMRQALADAGIGRLNTPLEGADVAGEHVRVARVRLVDAPPQAVEVRLRKQKCQTLTQRISDLRDAAKY